MMMFVKTVFIPKLNDSYVYLAEGYRDSKNKVKHRNIESYGRLSLLLDKDPEALDRLEERAAQLSEVTEEAIIQLSINMNTLDEQNLPRQNYGYVFLQALYNELHIPEFLSEYQTRTSVQYPLNEILELLVYSRALNPSSKKRTYEDKGNYFFELPDFSLDDVYRSLTHLSSMKDELTLHLHRRIQETRGRDCSLVFYDVTNYYFESENMEGLRQKGVSKENRETGIVQMGLFIDNEGIPITYELFPGNTNDMSTMRPILEKIKKEYGLGKITIVADKGNNTGENLA